MPELPEVEICRRNLARWAEGRRLQRVEVLDAAVVRPKLSTRPSDALEGGQAQVEAMAGQTAGAVRRHGKRLGWTFGEQGLLIHLGMTGAWQRERPERHGRLGLHFDEGSVWFRDSRRFGCVVPVPAHALDDKLRERHGPDALDEPQTGEALAARFASRKAIKVALLDQDRIAGVGNIHAVEALFRCGIAPDLPARDLTTAQWQQLSQALVRQLQWAIDDQDSEDFTYITDGGPNPFAVYDREDQPCPTCTTPIARAVHGGRSTFWCPSCQPS